MRKASLFCLISFLPLVACGSAAVDTDESTAALSDYLTGLTAIDAQNSANAKTLVDGKTGVDIPQWASPNIYDASLYPMRAVIDLGRTYDVSEVDLFHGNGDGTAQVMYLPDGHDWTVASNYKLVEAHHPSLWNAWEKVAQSGTYRTRYLELTVSSYADYPNYSEIRVRGNPVSTTTPTPPPTTTTPPPPTNTTCNLTVGTGSGSLDIESKSNEVVCVKAGTYSGGTFANLSGVKIVPLGPITFTGGIGIHSNHGLTIDGTVLAGVTYGFTFNGSFTAFDPGTTNNQDLTIRGALFEGATAVAGDGNRITYNGSPATTLFTNLTLDTIKLTGKGMIYSGTWEPPNSYRSIVLGMTLSNVIVENDPNGHCTKVFGNSLYKLVADHWHVTGSTLSAGEPDTGIFHMVGNATFRNFYRNGGYGYIARLWNVSLGTQSDSYFYNIIDVNSQEYGTADVRIDATQMQGAASGLPLSGNNVYLYNVTSGMKKTRTNSDGTPYYRSPLAIVGDMNDGKKSYDVRVENCFAFDNAQSQDEKGSLYRADFNAGDCNLTLANNLAVEGPLPAGYLVDQTTTFAPVPGGPLVGKGLVISQTATDINGKSRGASYDLGAVQH